MKSVSIIGIRVAQSKLFLGCFEDICIRNYVINDLNFGPLTDARKEE